MSFVGKHLHRTFEHATRVREDMHDYQAEAVEFMWTRPFSALFIDTGLGKTIICLTLIDRLLTSTYLTGQIPRILVIAPIRVAAQTWPTEISQWAHAAPWRHSVIRAEDDDPEVISAGKEASARAKVDPEIQRLAEERSADLMFWAVTPEEIAKASVKRQHLKLVQSAGSKARTAKKEELRRRRAASDAPIHIIDLQHVEWLVDLHCEVIYSGQTRKKKWKVKTWPYDVVFIDESSAFKDHTTTRFRALNAVRSRIMRMHQLTATPAAESYLHLFPQIFLLDRGERFGRSVTHYRRTYFDYNEYNMQYKLKPGAEKKISRKIADICLVMKSQDYLKEEPPLFLTRNMRLEPWQLDLYMGFERDLVMRLPPDEEEEEGVLIEAITAADLSGKLCQLASGAIYDAAKKVHELHRHKIEDLAQLYDELQVAGEPLMVAYWYKHSLARLKKAFPKAVVMDSSGKCVKDWNAGKIPILLVHPASVGHGLNMQYGPGHDIYFFDMPWSYELYYQLYRRLHRQGQKKRVRIHLAQVAGTADEVVAERLLDKENAQEALFNWIKRLRRAANDNERRSDERRFRIAA